MTPRRQARTRIIHDAHCELAHIAADGREALAGVHDGLTEALAELVDRVERVAAKLAGPAPLVQDKPAHPAPAAARALLPQRAVTLSPTTPRSR